jgi:hypothetical protein
MGRRHRQRPGRRPGGTGQRAGLPLAVRPVRAGPRADGAYGDVRTTALILTATAGALAATGLVQLLMLGTLRPRLFFGWIVALVTTIAEQRQECTTTGRAAIACKMIPVTASSGIAVESITR